MAGRATCFRVPSRLVFWVRQLLSGVLTDMCSLSTAVGIAAEASALTLPHTWLSWCLLVCVRFFKQAKDADYLRRTILAGLPPLPQRCMEIRMVSTTQAGRGCLAFVRCAAHCTSVSHRGTCPYGALGRLCRKACNCLVHAHLSWSKRPL